MQGRQLIATTNIDEHHALAWQGTKVYASFDQLRRLLASRLSPAHAALFAEPLPDDVRRKADWYFISELEQPSAVQPMRLSDLPLEAQAPVREKLISLGRDIYLLSQELKNSPDSNQHTAGNLLEMALTFPSEDYIYVVAATPVLIAWGFSSGSSGAQPEMLTRLRHASPSLAGAFTAGAMPSGTTMPANNPDQKINYETRIHRISLPWILLAFLIGALLAALLLYFFGPKLGLSFGGFGLGGCSRQAETHNATMHNATETPGEELLRAQTLEHTLRAELERLRQELLARLAQCERGENIPALPNVPEDTPEEPDTLTIPEEPVEELPEEIIPDVPDLTLPDIPEDLPDEPTTEPPAENPPPEEPNNLEIPEQAENMNFLKGCWDAPTGLINLDTNQPVIVEYCFDESGKGTVRITEFDRNGKPKRSCEGNARAQMSENQLAIEDDGAVCPDNSLYHGNRVICYKDKKGNTVCKGTAKDGPKNEWGPVPFRETQE